MLTQVHAKFWHLRQQQRSAIMPSCLHKVICRHNLFLRKNPIKICFYACRTDIYCTLVREIYIKYKAKKPSLEVIGVEKRDSSHHRTSPSTRQFVCDYLDLFRLFIFLQQFSPTSSINMSNTESTSMSTQRSKLFTTAVDLLRLFSTDALSICFFFHAYNQSVSEIKECARAIVARGIVTADTATQVQIPFCVDSELLEPTLTLSFIDNTSSFETLRNTQHWKYLDKKAEESREVVTLEELDEIVACKLGNGKRYAKRKCDITDLKFVSREFYDTATE